MLLEQQLLLVRAPAGSFLLQLAILSFAVAPLRPHDARTRARAYWSRNTPKAAIADLNQPNAGGRIAKHDDSISAKRSLNFFK